MNLGPSSYCLPPPVVDNAEASQYSNATLGETVLYACKKGYVQIDGDSRLACVLTADYSSTWSGQRINCGKNINTEYLSVSPSE